MKENLERLFKEQLENYEMPYENGAWEQFSKRLDGSPATSFYRKWWFAASVGTVLVGSAIYFGLNSTETAADPVKEVRVAVEAEQNEPRNEPKESVPASGSYSDVQTGEDQLQTYTDRAPADRTEISQTSPAVVMTPEPVNSMPVIVPATPEKYLALDLPKTACVNTPVSVVNPNEKATVYVVLPNGSRHTVKPKEKLSFASAKPGSVQVISGTHVDYIAIEESAANLYIYVDPVLLYDNGVPLLKFKATGAENGVIWESDVAAQRTSGNELIVNPFVETKVTVAAHTTDQNGCTVKQESTVRLDGPYNLMASTGFNPMSSDTRNNRFMPFALTQRDTPFELTIMDPNTQAVIFRSSDASMGWDGTGRNGELVPLNSTWLWRVVMKDPLPGEPTEYKGLITYQDR